MATTQTSSLLLKRGSTGYFDGEILPSSLHTIFRKDRGGNKRGGGVLLAVKTDLLAYRRLDLEPQNSEILVCDFVSPTSFKITVCLCYRPIDRRTVLYLCITLSVYLQICVKLLIESALLAIPICLPIDQEYVSDFSNSTDGVKFCNQTNSHFLTQVMKEPRLLEFHTPARLFGNCFFFNCPEEIFDVNAVEDFSSDHLARSVSRC